jgi:DNA-binding response OmpR family regulator
MGNAFPLTGRSILVVEDEPLIALEIAALLQSAGAEVISARTRGEAYAVIEARRVCAAVLDWRLGDDDGAGLCRLLGTREIPFMFYSGYSDLQERFPKSVIVQKPAMGDALVSAMTGLISPAVHA